MNLDAATGQFRWYYQGVPDDFKDYDMQASPIEARVGGSSVVIGSGKMGYVYEMNASTGKLIWKTPVGEHNGDDNDSLQALEHRSTLKAPFTILPGPLGGVLADLAVVCHEEEHPPARLLAALPRRTRCVQVESPSGHQGPAVTPALVQLTDIRGPQLTDIPASTWPFSVVRLATAMSRPPCRASRSRPSCRGNSGA